MYTKYPRSYHLPWSPGAKDIKDDKRMSNVNGLLNVNLVITEKMDGGNVCLERNNCFARSHGQPPTHRSYDAFKGLHARVKHLIPPDVQFFGEWLYAKTSIHYQKLPNYLMLFGVRNKITGQWHNWTEVSVAATLLRVPTVPVLRITKVKNQAQLENLTNKLAKERSTFGDREGIVVRDIGRFADEDFTKCLGKWVRVNHITDRGYHWKYKKIERNVLSK